MEKVLTANQTALLTDIERIGGPVLRLVGLYLRAEDLTEFKNAAQNGEKINPYGYEDTLCDLIEILSNNGSMSEAFKVEDLRVSLGLRWLPIVIDGHADYEPDKATIDALRGDDSYEELQEQIRRAIARENKKMVTPGSDGD